MAGKKITVVISQAQGKNPARRQLEEETAAALIMEPEIDVSLVPHLYDMSADHTGVMFLRSVPGDVVVLSWLYPRAARWTLDRHGIHGQEGVTLLKSEDDEDEDLQAEQNDDAPPRVIESREIPQRKIYCIDLRVDSDVVPYLDEIRRISSEQSTQTVDLMQWISGDPKAEQLQRYLQPKPSGSASQTNGNGAAHAKTNGNGQAIPVESVKRRWYPVIDYSLCTNCMECIDFCLFGVYGIDQKETILVEQQDNCKKGCPACSRVCPENAIIFPGHKTPAIAGAAGEVAGLKIDLSKLFGAPDGIDAAVAERDAELIADGREAVGMSVGLPKRQTGVKPQQHDELDDLMDGLDQLDF